MGEKLTYICKEGKMLDQHARGGERVGGGDGYRGEEEEEEEQEEGARRTVSVVCGADGKYKLPKEWPKCV